MKKSFIIVASAFSLFSIFAGSMVYATTYTSPYPLVSISASSTAMYAGQSTSIEATFEESTTSITSLFANVGIYPEALAFDSSGNLYVVNGGSDTVSKITPDGVVSTFATVGSSPNALALDSSDNVYVANSGDGTISKITPDGVVTTFASGLDEPYALAFDSSGNLYVANYSSDTVSEITPSGTVSTFATVGETPYALAFDSSGNLYVANYSSYSISKITPDGVVTTFATGLITPDALAFDSSDNLYVAEYANDTVSKITPDGVVTTFATGLNSPWALATDSSDDLYVANLRGNTVSEITPSGTTTTFATGLNYPMSLAFDSSGNLYVANDGNNTVSKITPPSYDTLTADDIDEPLGTDLGASMDPLASQAITFSTTTPGTYTFYAVARTSYYPSWTSYGSVTVTVTPPLECTISLSPTSITSGESATLSWSSSNTTAFSIDNVGSEPADATGSIVVSPSVSTDYTGTVSIGSVQNTCTAPGTSPAGTLSVSCTPAYTCKTVGRVQFIRYTNASCQVSNVATCMSPEFCSAGSSSCQ